jgi:hypothetical protein
MCRSVVSVRDARRLLLVMKTEPPCRAALHM